MNGIVTWNTLWAVIAAVVVACFAVWWRIENKVKEAKKSAYYKCDAAHLKVEAAAAETGSPGRNWPRTKPMSRKPSSLSRASAR